VIAIVAKLMSDVEWGEVNAMNKKLASSIAIGLFLLIGCAASGPKLASSAEDIAGTWQSTIGSQEAHFNEDGTLRVEFVGNAHANGEYWFEGTRFFMKKPFGNECFNEETGIYEIELLENGNLKLTVIEDECLQRVNISAGRLVEVEWEPVP